MEQLILLLLVSVVSTPISAVGDSTKLANDDTTAPKFVEKRPEKQIAKYIELIGAARKVPIYSPRKYYGDYFTWENIARDYEVLRNGGKLRRLDSEGQGIEKRYKLGSRSIMLDNIGHVYHLGHRHQHKDIPSIVYLDEDDEQRQILLRCTYSYHPGSGSDNFAMFYYSVKDNNCFPFVYTGEGGNSNRFTTYEECMQTCTTTPSLKWQQFNF